MERVRRRLETPAEINELTDKPVVGRLPRQRALQRVPASLVWSQERMTGLQESYRALRTNVQFLAEGKRVIEVTSPDPAQGKSTVVANLGAALAQIGVDMRDRRRGPAPPDAAQGLRRRQLDRALDAAVGRATRRSTSSRPASRTCG